MIKDELSKILIELKNAALSLQNDADDAYKLIHKYDMVFAGEKVNTIYSNELVHMLKTKKNLDITLAELDSILPEICASLNMKVSPTFPISDNQVSDHLIIELY